MTIKLVRVTRLDSIRLDGSFFTPEGFFIDAPKVTRTGIFEYKNPDGSTRRELRLPEHVFDESSLETYEGKPVIITHGAGRADKGNIADEIVGTMISKGYKDGDSVRVKTVIHDIDSVKKSGLRELSLGYDLDLIEKPGNWRGQSYDAIQTNIVVNHLALVRDARAGEQARLNLDSKNEKGATRMGAKKSMGSAELQKALAACKKKGLTNLDEIELVLMKELAEFDKDDMGADAAIPPDIDANGDAEVVIAPDDKVKTIKEKYGSLSNDSGSPTREDYISDVGELLKCIEYLQARNDASAAAQDASHNTGPDENKEGTMNADSIDAIVSERIRLGRLGDKLNLDGLEEMRPVDAKVAIVKAVLPNMRLDGKSDVYIQAAFDQAVEQINTRKDVNYQRQQMTGGGLNRMDGRTPPVPNEKTMADQSREKMMERMTNGGSE